MKDHSISLNGTADSRRGSTHHPGTRRDSMFPTDSKRGSTMSTTYHHGPRRFSVRVEAEKGHFKQLFWRHKYTAATYCSVFWTAGMCNGFLGPTLWDLSCQTGTTLSNMTWVFFTQATFMLIGSVVGGVLLHKISASFVILMSTTFIMMTFFTVPFCESILPLGLVLALMGLNVGLIDTTANASFIKIFNTDVTPFLQALHFSYGFGAFVSPMIVEPFLKNFDCSKFLMDNSTQAGTSWFEQNEMVLEATGKSVDQPKSLAEAQEQERINRAFLILGILQIPVVLLSAILFFRDRMVIIFGKINQYENIEKIIHGLDDRNKISIRKVIHVIILAGILLFIGDGMQGVFGGLIFTYGRLNVPNLTMKNSATVTAIFWGFFASGRLATIIISTYFESETILACDITGCLLSIVLLSAVRHSFVVLCIGTAIFGLFLSNVCPTTISLAEQFINIGPFGTSCMVVSAAAGEMFYPLILGNILYKYGPNAFLILCNASLISLVIAFMIFWQTGSRATKDVFEESGKNSPMVHHRVIKE